MHVFNVDTMQKFTSQAELHAPHLRLLIPPVALPQIMKPCFRGGLLPDFRRLMINAARNGRGMLAKVKRCDLLPAQPRHIRPVYRNISRTPVLTDRTRDKRFLPVG